MSVQKKNGVGKTVFPRRTCSKGKSQQNPRPEGCVCVWLLYMAEKQALGTWHRSYTWTLKYLGRFQTVFHLSDCTHLFLAPSEGLLQYRWAVDFVLGEECTGNATLKHQRRLWLTPWKSVEYLPLNGSSNCSAVVRVVLSSRLWPSPTGISETWWDGSCNWSALLDGYRLFRRERQRSGGGVTLWKRRVGMSGVHSWEPLIKNQGTNK